jgi:hypothetical protein
LFITGPPWYWIPLNGTVSDVEEPFGRAAEDDCCGERSMTGTIPPTLKWLGVGVVCAQVETLRATDTNKQFAYLDMAFSFFSTG